MPLRKIKGGMLPGIALNRLAKNKHVRNFLGGGGGGELAKAPKPKLSKATAKKKASGKSRKTKNTRQAKKSPSKMRKY